MARQDRACGGFALVTVLALSASVLIAVAAVVGYVAGATRQTAMAVGRDVCRLAAQSGIELAKSKVGDAFQSTLTSPKVVGSSINASTACAFDWFVAYSGSTAKRTIGTRNAVMLPDSLTINGCAVQVGIARVEHASGEQSAVVTFVAEAVRTNPGGTVSSSTIAEAVRFAQQRSPVFDNAYFVNNYGWFQGTGCTANGDVRANGNMYLDSGCKINGKVYAACNSELGVRGEVTNYGTMDSYSTYKSSTYGASNMSRPLSKDPVTEASVAGGYDAPASATTQVKKDRILDNSKLHDVGMDDLFEHPDALKPVEMPYIGDVSSESSDYRAWAQSLHDADSSMSTIKQGGNTIVSVYYDGVGPSGLTTVTDAYGNEVAAPDYGVLVLEGTQNSPIEINGPVVVPNDVIIKGYVKGQGTIYSGRNIHIVGNIQYVNPPSWSGKRANSGNSTKDMLGLMAKGNIVMGNYTDSNWLSSIRTYLTTQPYVQQYVCDTSDASIGYPSTFGGSYAATEHVSASDYAKCAAAGLADFTPGGYDSSSGRFGKLRETTVTLDTGHWEGSGWNRRWVADTETRLTHEYNRKYYESVCADSEVSSRCSTITRIDAVLYNNHGTFGKLGQCSINGSLVCRNEGLQYSSKLYLNWDIRLYSGSSESVDNDKVGLAKGVGGPSVISWMEVPHGFIGFAQSQD